MGGMGLIGLDSRSMIMDGISSPAQVEMEPSQRRAPLVSLASAGLWLNLIRQRWLLVPGPCSVFGRSSEDEEDDD